MSSANNALARTLAALKNKKRKATTASGPAKKTQKPAAGIFEQRGAADAPTPTAASPALSKLEQLKKWKELRAKKQAEEQPAAEAAAAPAPAPAPVVQDKQSKLAAWKAAKAAKLKAQSAAKGKEPTAPTKEAAPEDKLESSVKSQIEAPAKAESSDAGDALESYMNELGGDAQEEPARPIVPVVTMEDIMAGNVPDAAPESEAAAAPADEPMTEAATNENGPAVTDAEFHKQFMEQMRTAAEEEADAAPTGRIFEDDEVSAGSGKGGGMAL